MQYTLPRTYNFLKQNYNTVYKSTKKKPKGGKNHILDYVKNVKLLCIKTLLIERQMKARKNIFVTCITHKGLTFLTDKRISG